MEKHLQPLPQPGRRKRATSARVGVAAGAAVFIPVSLGVSGRKQVWAANFFYPIKGEGQPRTIAPKIHSAGLGRRLGEIWNRLFAIQ